MYLLTLNNLKIIFEISVFIIKWYRSADEVKSSALTHVHLQFVECWNWGVTLINKLMWTAGIKIFDLCHYTRPFFFSKKKKIGHVLIFFK